MPPIKCTPCRVMYGGKRYRVYKDGSTSIALSRQQIEELGLQNVKEVLEYEANQPRLGSHEPGSKAIRQEASRLRRNRNARKGLRDLGMKKTAYGWE